MAAIRTGWGVALNGLNILKERGMQDPSAILYAVGVLSADDTTLRDPRMNQEYGSRNYQAAWHDGALVWFSPKTNTWTALFIASYPDLPTVRTFTDRAAHPPGGSIRAPEVVGQPGLGNYD